MAYLRAGVHVSCPPLHGPKDETPVLWLLEQYGTDSSEHNKIYHLLRQLQAVLESGIDGDVVELGCFAGESSVFVRRLLDYWEATAQDSGFKKRAYHVYDSWEGVPPPVQQDLGQESGWSPFLVGGSLKIARQVFEGAFASRGLALPHIHSGWFGQIPDAEYPERIAFAFFDGDMYSSIVDSFVKVYPRLAPGARVVIDDYAWQRLPGVLRACDDFLADKPERVIAIRDYSAAGRTDGGGLLIRDGG